MIKDFFKRIFTKKNTIGKGCEWEKQIGMTSEERVKAMTKELNSGRIKTYDDYAKWKEELIEKAKNKNA